jgi:hypothetical protein
MTKPIRPPGPPCSKGRYGPALSSFNGTASDNDVAWAFDLSRSKTCLSEFKARAQLVKLVFPLVNKNAPDKV